MYRTMPAHERIEHLRALRALLSRQIEETTAAHHAAIELDLQVERLSTDASDALEKMLDVVEAYLRKAGDL